MFRLQYDRDMIITLIDHIIDKTFSMDMPWDWPCGVAYYGVCEAYQVTGKNI